MLRGSLDSVVRVTIRRQGTLKRFNLTRKKVEFPQLECRIVGKQTVYLRPYGLNKGTGEAMLSQSAALDGTGAATKLVLDLRGNRGGLLAAAVAIADLFLDEGQIVELQSRTGDDMSFRATKAGGIFGGSPVTVLVDRETSAGAELIAAALQDHRRAQVVGTPTARMGSVQTVFPLQSGMLKLTSHQMKRPSGNLLSEVGVMPDVAPEESVEGSVGALHEERPCPGSQAPARALTYDGTLRIALDNP